MFNHPFQRRQWHPTPVLLPGKSHGQRSLVGCSPWGHKELDTIEQLHFHFSLWCTGEGNGNTLQCSCLENPRDGGAWWAAVYGVAQSQTRLTRLHSSSSMKSFLSYLSPYLPSWKKKSVSRLVLSTSLQPHGLYVAHQTPLSRGFSRQEYWGGLPFPSPGDLHNPGVEPGFPVLQEDSLPSEPPRKPISHPSHS